MRNALKGCLALLALGSPPAWSDALDDYMALAVGEFSSAIQAQNDARYAPITWQIVEIWQGDANKARWLYTESWMDGAETPYMQRISRITPRGDGTLLAERFTIPEANRFISAWSEPGRFASLDADDLEQIDDRRNGRLAHRDARDVGRLHKRDVDGGILASVIQRAV